MREKSGPPDYAPDRRPIRAYDRHGNADHGQCRLSTGQISMMRIAALGTFVFLSSAAALAQIQPPAAVQGFHGVHLKGACVEDRKRFCSTVKPGEGRLVDCYDAHKSELSEACHKQLDWIMNAREIEKRQHAWLATHKPKNSQSSAPPAVQSPAQPAPPK
jgi:hypothetical protein